MCTYILEEILALIKDDAGTRLKLNSLNLFDIKIKLLFIFILNCNQKIKNDKFRNTCW